MLCHRDLLAVVTNHWDDGGGAGIGSSALRVSMLTQAGGASILEVPAGSW